VTRAGRPGPPSRRRAARGLAAALLLSAACATPPPRRPDDACAIFSEHRSWHRAARESGERWGVPEPVQLALVHQESRFRHDARPARRRILWVLPGPRPSSAYGYGQVLDETWDLYRRETGRRGADRDDFADVADFIGWYGDLAHRRAGVAKDDAYALYLAYHEGPGGYARGTHLRRPWLLEVARKVDARAALYRLQYGSCRERLSRRRFF
jgi:hypothetical protein